MTTGQPGYGKTSASPASKKRPRKGSFAHGLLKRLKRASKAFKEDPTDDNKRIKEQVERELNSRYYIQFQRHVLYLKKSKGLDLTIEDAEEIADDTCERIINRIETYRERGSRKLGKKASGGRSWMMKICKNITIDWVKEKQKEEQAISLHKKIHEIVVDDIFLEEEEEGLSEDELKLLKIRKLMQTLPENAQKVLREGKGKGYPEALELLRKAVLDNPDFLQ